MPVLLIVISCGNNSGNTPKAPAKASGNWDRERAEKEYRSLMARLDLANIDRPYLVIDFDARSLNVMLRGAVIWDCRMDLGKTDSTEIREFVEKFRGNNQKLVRPLSQKHLYEAAEKTPDSVLAIVGKAVKVDPELLQRDLPERFLLIWNDDMILDIHTDIEGQPVSYLQNALEEIKQIVVNPFGAVVVTLKMEPDDALTLYRAAERGMMTMISL